MKGAGRVGSGRVEEFVLESARNVTKGAVLVWWVCVSNNNTPLERFVGIGVCRHARATSLGNMLLQLYSHSAQLSAPL